MKPKALLQYLDNPVRILMFSVNELIAYMLPFFIGAFFESMFVIPIIGLTLIYMLKRLMRGVPKYYAIRMLYWAIPTSYYNKFLGVRFPPSNQRMWIK